MLHAKPTSKQTATHRQNSFLEAHLVEGVWPQEVCGLSCKCWSRQHRTASVIQYSLFVIGATNVLIKSVQTDFFQLRLTHNKEKYLIATCAHSIYCWTTTPMSMTSRCFYRRDFMQKVYKEKAKKDYSQPILLPGNKKKLRKLPKKRTGPDRTQQHKSTRIPPHTVKQCKFHAKLCKTKVKLQENPWKPPQNNPKIIQEKKKLGQSPSLPPTLLKSILLTLDSRTCTQEATPASPPRWPKNGTKACVLSDGVLGL